MVKSNHVKDKKNDRDYDDDDDDVVDADSLLFRSRSQNNNDDGDNAEEEEEEEQEESAIVTAASRIIMKNKKRNSHADDNDDDDDNDGVPPPLPPTAAAPAAVSPATWSPPSPSSSSSPRHNHKRVALLQTLVLLSLALIQQRMGGGATTAAASATAAAAAQQSATNNNNAARTASSVESKKNQAAEAIIGDCQEAAAAMEEGVEERGSFLETYVNSFPDAVDDDDDNRYKDDSLSGDSIESKSESGDRQKEDKEVDNDDDNDDDVIIVIATVDGTFAGLNRATGRILWKRSNQQEDNSNNNNNNIPWVADDPSYSTSDDAGDIPPPLGTPASMESSRPSSPVLKPLVSTTTTTGKAAASGEGWRTSAVPSIDGSVYLTAAGRGHHGGADTEAGTASSSSSSGASASAVDVTVTTTMQDLVTRAPFVDARGRIYTGSTHATAFCLDGATGELLHVASADAQTPDPSRLHHNRRRSSSSNTNNNSNDAVVWLGRIDASVAIHEPHGRLDVRFSSSRVMGVRDMLLGSEPSQTQPPWKGGDGDDYSYGGSQLQPAVVQGRTTTFAGKPSSSAPSSSSSLPATLVATPNGNVAYRNSLGQIEWVADECFDTPVAFAVDSGSGSSLQVDVVPDAILPNERSTEYLTREMERQATLLLAGSNDDTYDDDEEEGGGGGLDEQTIVGSLSSGELFAVPLGRRSPTSGPSGGTANQHRRRRSHHHTASATASAVPRVSSHFSSSLPVTASSSSSSSARQHSPQQQYHGGLNYGSGPVNDVGCHAGSPYFPDCLVHSSSAEDYIGPYRVPGGESGNAHHDGAVVPFYYTDLGYIPPPNHYTLKDSTSKSHRRYKKMLRIFGSWLPPTIALIFVLSFELGRRKRQLDSEKQPSELESNELSQLDRSGRNHKTSVGDRVIQVCDDIILGYGGHGTVVYKGTLEGRQVAVKRLLKAYHASADREITLLIESDGHPNVVRYFLKEVRGDFVYLALELCDLSLHDLIAKLRIGRDLSEKDTLEKENVFPSHVSIPTKTVLFQIACGVKHLHQLRIVHRDLKPMNILLADGRKKSKRTDSQSVLDIFYQGNYVAKISDMGLGKQLVGQSSYGASLAGDASLRGMSNGAQSSIAGPGPGSVGWQAPEVMAFRAPSDSSVRSDGSNPASDLADASPIDNTVNTRTSRSSDIFSLGCIFYSTLIPGSHPFGEWYEREANIMHNRPINIDALQKISPGAYDLVSSMIERNQIARPTAKEICEHPFFWTPERRLAFLCDFSDRLEIEAVNADGDAPSAFATKTLLIERNASKVVGLAWDCILDNDLISNVQRFRTYDPSSVRDLLRLIRNKHHHFDELPLSLKADMMGSNTDGLMTYFEERFPSLVIHCYNVGREILPPDDPLSAKYCISPVKRSHTQRLDIQVSTITEGTEQSPLEPLIDEVNPVGLSDEPIVKEDDDDGGIGASHITDDGIEVSPTQKDAPAGTALDSKELSAADAVETIEHSNKPTEQCPADANTNYTLQAPPDTGDLVIWQGSTAAKTFNCRGWSRSDDEWERRTDASLHSHKRDPGLIRCADEPRFRTRLCNHWDASQGMSCPMLKRKKCIFAHGPVELRVKEGKRHRWGKLVDSKGDNSNPRHSGGEDTYGAARSIETERKQEGKWKTDKKQQKGKKTNNRNKKKANTT